MNNGMPIGGPVVPDLAAIRNGQAVQDIPAQVQQMILGAAGIEPGTDAQIDLGGGYDIRLAEPLPMVLFSPAGIAVVGLTGSVGGKRRFVPWHAVQSIEAAS